jgi:CheY-like chemotaxis protein
MRAAKELTPGIKGLALSGFGREEDIGKSLEAGFEKHLVKPFTMQGLTQAIDRAAGTKA